MSHKQVLQRLGCDDLSTLIPAQFLSRFGLGPPGQYGMVARDVPAAIRLLRDAGASEFVHANMRPPQWVEAGIARKGVVTEVAFGYSNHQQIELLGPGQNTTLYTDAIPRDGRITLHHACVFMKGIDAAEKNLNAAGYPTVVSGNVGLKNIFTTRFRYFDTRAELGIYLELCEYLLFTRHAPPGESLLRFIARRQRRFAG